MSKKGLVEEAKDTLVDAAKVGAQGVKSVGSEALGAAATAAAGVVLGRVSQALGAGQEKVEEAVPPFRAAAGDKVKIADRSKKAKSSRMKTRAAKKKKSASARRTDGQEKAGRKKSSDKETDRQSKALILDWFLSRLIEMQAATRVRAARLTCQGG